MRTDFGTLADAQGPTFPGERFAAALVPSSRTAKIEASKPYKARSVPGEDGLEFKKRLSPCAH